MMRIIIAGSRSVSEQDVRKALMFCMWTSFATSVLSGTAGGADTYGEKWARENNIEIIHYPADWKKYGRKGGPVRNKIMAENAEGLISIWDGFSRGTLSMIELATRLGLRIFIYRTDNNTVEERSAKGQLANLWEYAEERAALIEYGANLPRREAEREAGVLAVQILEHKITKNSSEASSQNDSQE